MSVLDRLKHGIDEALSAQELDDFRRDLDRITKLSIEYGQLTPDELRAKTDEFRDRLAKGESLDQLLPEAFAVCRVAARRVLGYAPFDVQVMGGMALHRGTIVEMKAGEGKTITETMPVYLNALERKGVHVITTNDYLAKRDAAWVGPIFELLGFTVGFVTQQLPSDERRAAYRKDVTYVTNQEVGFDYLRDHLAHDPAERVLGELNFGIVDEVDSILIDEARTPLIIAEAMHGAEGEFPHYAAIAAMLEEGKDYTVDRKEKTVELTEAGITEVQRLIGEKFTESEDDNRLYQFHQALRAKTLFEKERDYIIEDGKVVIVDEFTGRLMPDRRFMDDIHQAIEAKEGVKVREPERVVATITFQNFFRLYKKLSGMSGTAATARDEFRKIYGLETYVIPTNRPLVRRDLPDAVYATESAKLAAIADEAWHRHRAGQPVLIGTRTVEMSAWVSQALSSRDVPHQVLNAKHAQEEAEVVARAGRSGLITVATNMAGRGTDIILAADALAAGGLCVIGTERHESRRIDDQLRGRSGRQGASGSSQFFTSFEDDLVRLYAPDTFWDTFDGVELPDDRPVYHAALLPAVDIAQQAAETLHFEARQYLYRFDEILDRQRTLFYRDRDSILTDDFGKDGTLPALTASVPLPETFPAAGTPERSSMRRALLAGFDAPWARHLQAIDDLQDSINLIAYGQEDPLVTYTTKAHELFEQFRANLAGEVNDVLRARIGSAA
ncbi:preprotein translocase subunit SecA [Candidatus Parcubacteria bacterium]|nr:preprotein translocase subunit SecA [Candidatus Parcubacteria bacterium]